MVIRIPGSPLPGSRSSRLDVLGLFFALLFLIVGSLFLNDRVSNSDTSQTVRVITGAMFLSLGLVNVYGALEKWWKLQRIYKETDDQ